MWIDLAELAVHRFKDGGSDIHGIPSVFNQCVLVTAKTAEVDEVVPSSGGSVHKKPGEIVIPDVIVENNDEDSDLEGIMTAKKSRS